MQVSRPRPAMWVHPSLRRRGAGRALVEAVLGCAVTGAPARSGCTVMVGNVPGRLLYERCGFCASGVGGDRRRRPAGEATNRHASPR